MLGGMIEPVVWGERNGWMGEWVVGCEWRCLGPYHLSSRYGIPG